ncbi:MAG: thioesterase domain-containing protein, partial [Verrucomicrobiota bacterium]
EQPCYGFQSIGFGRKEDSHTRVKEMAAYYIQQMRSLQPQGPYYLGGWCYGGIVAVEMGHQLLAAGQEIALIALIETPAPAPSYSNIRYYGRRVGCLLSMKPREWNRYLGEKVKYYRGVKRENEMRFRKVDKSEADATTVEKSSEHLAQLEHVYHTNIEALNFYDVRRYPRKVILFNAKENDPAQVADPLYGWPSLAADIEAHIVPGNHDTILMEPHVKVLAAKLADCLARSQKR